ncbi:hypothetical protein P7C73_g5717, partial [Tremellales sp. Uapishka_1]
MRLPLISSFLLPLIAAQNIQVYLHPAPANLHSPPTLSSDQAKAVLSHHLGEQIADFEEIPSNEGLWSHLMTMWGSEKGDEGKPRVVVIQGGVTSQGMQSGQTRGRTQTEPYISDVLPSTLSRPAFYLQDTDTSVLRPYLNRASHLLSHILDSMPKLAKTFHDVFDLAGTKAAATLSHELSCLTALADKLPWTDKSSNRRYPWEAISISGLNDVERDSEVWETGRLGVKAGLEAMTTPSSPPLLLVILPSHSSLLVRRSVPPPQKRASNATYANNCYPSNETCSDATDCFGRGSCSLKAKTSEGECWGCRCSSGYAGTECQKDDYTVPFVILVASSLLLMGILIGSIGLLYSVGETRLPSTLTLAIGGGAKRD